MSNIKIDLKGLEGEHLNLIRVAQDKVQQKTVVNTVHKNREIPTPTVRLPAFLQGLPSIDANYLLFSAFLCTFGIS
jgi:hypothetical protein